MNENDTSMAIFTTDLQLKRTDLRIKEEQLTLTQAQIRTEADKQERGRVELELLKSDLDLKVLQEAKLKAETRLIDEQADAVMIQGINDAEESKARVKADKWRVWQLEQQGDLCKAQASLTRAEVKRVNATTASIKATTPAQVSTPAPEKKAVVKKKAPAKRVTKKKKAKKAPAKKK